MPKSSRCPSPVIGCGIGSRMHAQFPSRPWRVRSDEEKVLTLMLKPESDLSAVPESGFGGPSSGPGPESLGRTKPCRAPISERPRPGAPPPAFPSLVSPLQSPSQCSVTCANRLFGPLQGPVVLRRNLRGSALRPPVVRRHATGPGGRTASTPLSSGRRVRVSGALRLRPSKPGAAPPAPRAAPPPRACSGTRPAGAPCAGWR
jgi:hypothetical protein